MLLLLEANVIVTAIWRASGRSTDRVLIFAQIWYVLTMLALSVRVPARNHVSLALQLSW